MVMKRFLVLFWISAFCLVGSAVQLWSQNNVYDMDDECYQLYLETVKYVGKPEFDSVNGELLRMSILKQDKRGQIFYYIGRLRHLIHLPFETREEDRDARLEEVITRGEGVIEAQEELKRVSRELDLMQYYYYSYQLVKNYFFNNNFKLRAMELVQEMRNIAVAEGDEYGRWVADKELSTLYQAQLDNLSARKYLLNVIKGYETTENPTIRRQVMCINYLDYGNTFNPGDDSLRYYTEKAYALAATPSDTIRCQYQFAIIHLMENDIAGYRRYRDTVLTSPYLAVLETREKKTERAFSAIDHVLDGTAMQYMDTLKTQSVPMLELLAKLAEKRGQAALACELKDEVIHWSYYYFAQTTELSMAEMNAQYHNNLLSADLAKKSHQVQTISSVAVGLMLAVLLIVIFGLLYYVQNLKKTRDKDEKMIAELMEANEKVRLADEAKTRFVQNMSHEVRTPLNAIVGFSQLLSLPDGSFPSEEKEEFSNHIVNNTKMLTMLLDDILNASAMDSGSYRIVYEEGECGFMCHEAISSAEHRLQPGVTMRYVPAFEGSYSFITDPRRVQQILINLLTNACKHTSKGEIRLGCSLEENPGEVTFYVEDTGPGVPADQAEKIFDRFTKLNSFVQGTGLGLSICREIAGKMGGRVFLDTAYTEGARFVFVLPQTPPVAEND